MFSSADAATVAMIGEEPSSLGAAEGLAIPCAAAFDTLQPIRRAVLTERARGPGFTPPARAL